ncbi:MAG: hypothetical protein WCT85_00710 [Parachlamydiales bacterium]|jgi:hypothetical protein
MNFIKKNWLIIAIVSVALFFIWKRSQKKNESTTVVENNPNETETSESLENSFNGYNKKRGYSIL